MKIIHSKQAKKYLEKLHKPKRDKIKAEIEKLPKGKVKPLKGKEKERRLLVDKYRVKFYIENDVIYITEIDSRGDIYK